MLGRGLADAAAQEELDPSKGEVISVQDLRRALNLAEDSSVQLTGPWQADVQTAFLDYAAKENVSAAAEPAGQDQVRIVPKSLVDKFNQILRIANGKPTLVDTAQHVEMNVWMAGILRAKIDEAARTGTLTQHGAYLYEDWLRAADTLQLSLTEALDANRDLFLDVAETLRLAPDQLRIFLTTPVERTSAAMDILTAATSTSNGGTPPANIEGGAAYGDEFWFPEGRAPGSFAGLGAAPIVPLVWIAVVAVVGASGVAAIYLTSTQIRAYLVARETTRRMQLTYEAARTGVITPEQAAHAIEESGALRPEPPDSGSSFKTFLTIGGVVVVGGLLLWAFQFLPKTPQRSAALSGSNWPTLAGANPNYGLPAPRARRKKKASQRKKASLKRKGKLRGATSV